MTRRRRCHSRTAGARGRRRRRRTQTAGSPRRAHESTARRIGARLAERIGCDGRAGKPAAMPWAKNLTRPRSNRCGRSGWPVVRRGPRRRRLIQADRRRRPRHVCRKLEVADDTLEHDAQERHLNGRRVSGNLVQEENAVVITGQPPQRPTGWSEPHLGPLATTGRPAKSDGSRIEAITTSHGQSMADARSSTAELYPCRGRPTAAPAHARRQRRSRLQGQQDWSAFTSKAEFATATAGASRVCSGNFRRGRRRVRRSCGRLARGGVSRRIASRVGRFWGA